MSKSPLAAVTVTFKDSFGSPERTFRPPHIFVIAIQRSSVEVTVPEGLALTVQTATCCSKDATSLYFSSASSPYTMLCAFHVPTITGINLEFKGPQVFELSTRSMDSAECSVFGTIARLPVDDAAASQAHQQATAQQSSVTTGTATEIEKKSPNNKRKAKDAPAQISQDDDEVTETAAVAKDADNDNKGVVDDDDDDDDVAPPVQPLTKKQRRKLANKKAKELEQTIRDLNGHVDPKSLKVTLPKAKSLYKERNLNGVLVKDVMIGLGGMAKPGRKVSIIYEGAFLDGTIFDKNQSRKSPLRFRQSTGQVVKGLEKGLEGMKVGGERIITIPPELGYGKKGSGNVIPPNSTLVFTVQLLSVG